ncbi:hypothetical protein J4Q44_G00350270 [Coregonus suidteri]|uniref:Uncharacterized protein n=1 Tax=Coregonus suidteri TaxID=861788 RepID=A0AAN8KKJ9_9TELE
MNANKSRFFPSLYDQSNACWDIWTSILQQDHNHCNAQQKQHQHQHQPVRDTERWPDTGILVVNNYQPLEVFSPPTGIHGARRSEMDEVNELAILMMELELGAQMGEPLDRGRYYFLSNLHTSVIQQLRRE